MSEEQEQVSAETEVSNGEDTTTEFVQMDPETEKRFNRVYGHMKQANRKAEEAERIANQAAQDNAKLVERLEKLDEAKSNQAVDDLRQEEKTAMEEGDYDRATAARDKITDLKVEAKIPKPEEKKPDELPPIDPGLKDRLNSWAAETDAEGNLLRPWADSEHEDNGTAMKLVTGILATNPNAPLDTLLDEIDKETKRLNRRPTRNAAAVLSGDGDVRPKAKKKTSLSSDQKAIAERMYPNLKAADAAKRYADAMEKYA